MKLSEAIAHLQQMVDDHGDMDFRLCDLDTRWSLDLEPKHLTYYNGHCEIYLEGYWEFDI
jgi:hypothetical protein